MGDYILFFSSKCLHCKELLNLLHKDVALNQKFIKVSVDTQGFKIPPYVKSVPTAIIPGNGQPQLLVGSAIFKWYNSLHTQNIEKISIQDWDPHTMAGYSDGFSYIENGDVIKKSFAFLNDGDHNIITPDEKNYSGDSSGSGDKNQPKTKLDNEFENFMAQRSYEVPTPITKL
jgi:thiol-disulfide isomerase/thioredoxin